MLTSFEIGRNFVLHKGSKAGIVGNKGQLVCNLLGVQKCKKFMETGKLSPNNQTVPNLCMLFQSIGNEGK